MAFDTKPNLSNAKFEQFADEILTLCGRTEIHGIIEIENSGILRLDDGNQALGKVMTSDVTGGTTWQIASITGASNGLTQSGQYVTLGGVLTGSTQIILTGNTFGITGCEGGAIGFGRFYQGETAGEDLETFKASAYAEIQLVNVNDSSDHCANLHLFDANGGAFILEGTSGTTKSSICFNHGFTNGIQIQDGFTSMGAVYIDDYSTKGILNPRWIPDYAAVTAATQTLAVGGVDTNIQYNNGGLLGGSNDFTWNNTTKQLNVCGDIAISGTSFFRAGTTTNSLEIGIGSNSTNSDNIVIGKNSCATATYAIGIGSCMGASASGAIMLGHNSSTLQSNNVINSFALSFEQTIPTFLVACEGVSYLVGETDTYPKLGVGVKTPTARIHILSTGATEGFRLQDNSEGLNKPLVSDANGNASWGALTVTCTDYNIYTGDTNTRIDDIETDVTTISGSVITNTNNITTLSATTVISITGASNGLCKTDAHNIKLGNDLIENTTIGLGGCGLVLGSGSTIINYVNLNNLAITAAPSGGTSNDVVLVWDNVDKKVKQVTQASLTVEVAQNKVVDTVTQSSHGFSVGNVVGWSGGTYNKAIADGTYSGETIGVVFDVSDANNFRVAQSGWLTGFTGLVQGTTYFLSTSVSGGLQDSEPTVDGQISNPIMVAQSTTEAIIFPYRGQIITSGATPPPPNATVAGFDIIGDDTTTGFTVIHNYGTRDVLVNVWEAQAPYQKVMVETSLTSTNSVDVDFEIAPATGEDYRVVITY